MSELITFFCSNGHKGICLPKPCIEEGLFESCEFCNSTKYVKQYGWGDDDYHCYIPEKPLKVEWLEVNNDKYKGEVNVDVFDVSRIEEWTDAASPFTDNSDLQEFGFSMGYAYYGSSNRNILIKENCNNFEAYNSFGEKMYSGVGAREFIYFLKDLIDGKMS